MGGRGAAIERRHAATAARAGRRLGFALAALLVLQLLATAAAEATISRLPECDGKEASHVGFVGGPGDDVIRGTRKRDVIVGGGGLDRIFGRGGVDRICGGAGTDTLNGGPGTDVVVGGARRDNMTGGMGRDAVFGGGGDDYLEELKRDRSKDNLWGGRGEDGIIGGSGSDLAGGGEGDDVIDGRSGGDIIIGSGGFDRLSGGRGADTMRGFEDDDSLRGGPGRDWLAGHAGRDTLNGFGGNDTLIGSAGNDNLLGAAGADRIDGESGRDLIHAGPGDDTRVRGGVGADLVFGDGGNDRLLTEGATDRCTGGVGNDLCHGGEPSPKDASRDPDECTAERKRSCKASGFPPVWSGRANGSIEDTDSSDGHVGKQEWTADIVLERSSQGDQWQLYEMTEARVSWKASGRSTTSMQTCIYQASKSYETSAAGTGLGMSIYERNDRELADEYSLQLPLGGEPVTVHESCTVTGQDEYTIHTLNVVDEAEVSGRPWTPGSAAVSGNTSYQSRSEPEMTVKFGWRLFAR